VGDPLAAPKMQTVEEAITVTIVTGQTGNK
jgi:hypothetical protein